MGTNSYSPSSLERARDELFSHIRRCGVLEAELDQREEWLADTVGRYCMPPKRHGDTDTSKDAEEESADIEAERDEVNAA